MNKKRELLNPIEAGQHSDVKNKMWSYFNEPWSYLKQYKMQPKLKQVSPSRRFSHTSRPNDMLARVTDRFDFNFIITLDVYRREISVKYDFTILQGTYLLFLVNGRHTHVWLE